MRYYLLKIMHRIKLAEKTDLVALGTFCDGSILGTKIMCQIKAYGFGRDFLSVWCCVTDENKIVAVISKFDDNVTLMCGETEVTEDINAFLGMIGYSSLCCSRDTAVKLGFADSVTKNAYIYAGSYDGGILGELGEELYRGCYALICESIPDSFSSDEEAYLSFLSDFTFRKRRGLARLKGFTEKGRVRSCALTGAETEEAAIISGVACVSSDRKKGLGKLTVLSLAEELKRENKDAYVIALNESAEGFYEHIGFQFTEKISFIERK